MPVDLDTHSQEVSLTPGTTKSNIVAFLYRNSGSGYTPEDIHERLEIPYGTAGTTLDRLHDEGYIGRTSDSYYHAPQQREDIQHYVAGLDQLSRMFDRYGDWTQTDADGGKSPPSGELADELESELDELENEPVCESVFSAGTLVLVDDPLGEQETRTVVVLAHGQRPHGSAVCTVMCLGSDATTYDHYTPELEEDHLSGLSFSELTYLMPWEIYTVPASSVWSVTPRGTLTEAGVRLTKKALLSLFSG